MAAYSRDFELNKPYGSPQLVFISSEVHLAAAAKTTVADMVDFRKFLRSTQGRQFLANTFAAELSTAVKKKDVTSSASFGPRRSETKPYWCRSPSEHEAGAHLCRLHVRFRVDRTLSALAVVGLRPTGPASVAKLGGMIVAHVGQQFTPVSTLPPTITGTPVQGQTLTTSTGTFSMTPTYAYAWQRCDAAGAACADIVGATAPTYVVAPEDVAATLRVTVTATNRFGVATGQSTQTAVVT